jgi:DNA-directed RNA polymerase specialized sigma24 family protein
VSQGGLAPQRTLQVFGPVSAAPPLDPRDDFGAVYEAHYQMVYRAVRGVVLDPHLAEDVTQDAFVKAYRARLRYRPTGSVEAWLCTIAVREAISRLRWSALQQRLLAAGRRLAASAGPPASLPEWLDELLSELSPAARAVVVLHFLHGYRYREIADILGIPAGTVASRLSQALTRMRRRARSER